MLKTKIDWTILFAKNRLGQGWTIEEEPVNRSIYRYFHVKGPDGEDRVFRWRRKAEPKNDYQINKTVNFIIGWATFAGMPELTIKKV